MQPASASSARWPIIIANMKHKTRHCKANAVGNFGIRFAEHLGECAECSCNLGTGMLRMTACNVAQNWNAETAVVGIAQMWRLH
jgi:hypothetical protein